MGYIPDGYFPDADAPTWYNAATLSEIEGSTVLAKEATVGFIEKWVLNRLSITVNGDGTETVRLFDNDSSTVLKTWIWDPVTKTRAMAV